MKYVVLVSLLFTGFVDASHIYEETVIDSPGVHKLTDQITFDLILAEKYDLAKFGVRVKLDPKTFDWDGTPGYESAVVKKILGEQFQIFPLLKAMYARIGNSYESTINACLCDVVRLYQAIEAEGVFYRDLKRKMDNQHERLKGDPDYEAVRLNNYRIVNGLFIIAEELVKEVCLRFKIWNESSKGQRVPAEKVAELFKKIIYQGVIDEKGLLEKTKEKLETLRKDCKVVI